MQYKFLVDGIWQVDQDQLCVQDEYGAINNLVFVEDSVSMPSALIREDAQSNLVSGFTSSTHLEVSAIRKSLVLDMVHDPVSFSILHSDNYS